MVFIESRALRKSPLSPMRSLVYLIAVPLHKRLTHRYAGIKWRR